MRRFTSYGPVDRRFDFCVERSEQISRCVSQLVGEPGEGGHYFTIRAPRQTGKTWLMQREVAELRALHGDRFVVAMLSMQRVSLRPSDSPEALFSRVPALFQDSLGMTRGQPGLVGWFGELLTEKFNPRPASIEMKTWRRVYAAACQVEPNNTMLNLLKKAKGQFLPQVLEIFSRTDVPFSYGQDWCNYLLLNGVIDSVETTDESGEPQNVCRFSSPFVQQRLFSDLSGDAFVGLRELPLLPLDRGSVPARRRSGAGRPLRRQAGPARRHGGGVRAGGRHGGAGGAVWPAAHRRGGGDHRGDLVGAVS